MGLFDGIGSALEGIVDFADAIFGFSGGDDTANPLLSAGRRVFSGAMGERFMDDSPGIPGLDIHDVVSPGPGGAGGATGSGLLEQQLSQSRRSDSNPFSLTQGRILMALGQTLMAGDPAKEAGRAAEAQYEARRKVLAKNYALPKRN